MTVQLWVDSAVHKDRFQRQGFLQDGDVSAHDISQASGCGRNVDAGPSGPSSHMQRHYNAFLNTCCVWAGCRHSELYSIVRWLLCNMSTTATHDVGCKMYRLSSEMLFVHISATFSLDQFRPHPSFLCVVYLYQPLQLWCLFSVWHLPHPAQRWATHSSF